MLWLYCCLLGFVPGDMDRPVGKRNIAQNLILHCVIRQQVIYSIFLLAKHCQLLWSWTENNLVYLVPSRQSHLLEQERRRKRWNAVELNQPIRSTDSQSIGLAIDVRTSYVALRVEETQLPALLSRPEDHPSTERYSDRQWSAFNFTNQTYTFSVVRTHNAAFNFNFLSLFCLFSTITLVLLFFVFVVLCRNFQNSKEAIIIGE